MEYPSKIKEIPVVCSCRSVWAGRGTCRHNRITIPSVAANHCWSLNRISVQVNLLSPLPREKCRLQQGLAQFVHLQGRKIIHNNSTKGNEQEQNNGTTTLACDASTTHRGPHVFAFAHQVWLISARSLLTHVSNARLSNGRAFRFVFFRLSFEKSQKLATMQDCKQEEHVRAKKSRQETKQMNEMRVKARQPKQATNKSKRKQNARESKSKKQATANAKQAPSESKHQATAKARSKQQAKGKRKQQAEAKATNKQKQAKAKC